MTSIGDINSCICKNTTNWQLKKFIQQTSHNHSRQEHLINWHMHWHKVNRHIHPLGSDDKISLGFGSNPREGMVYNPVTNPNKVCDPFSSSERRIKHNEHLMIRLIKKGKIDIKHYVMNSRIWFWQKAEIDLN